MAEFRRIVSIKKDKRIIPKKHNLREVVYSGKYDG